MNMYGIRAREYWQQANPSEAAALTDQFFESLGEEIEQQVLEVSLHLEASYPASDDYLKRVGQLTMAKKQAEELVFHDLVHSQVVVDVPLAEAFVTRLHSLPPDEELEMKKWMLENESDPERKQEMLENPMLPIYRRLAEIYAKLPADADSNPEAYRDQIPGWYRELEEVQQMMVAEGARMPSE